MKHVIEKINISKVTVDLAPPLWKLVIYDDETDKIETIERFEGK